MNETVHGDKKMSHYRLPKNMSYALSFAEFKRHPASDLIRKCHDLDKKKIKELTIYDLIMCGRQPLVPPYGVYLFFDAHNRPLYVGKASRRQFVERIPDHLALGDKAWFNVFLRRLSKNGNLAEAALKASKCRLLLILIPQTDRIGKLEKFLRIMLRPCLNHFKEGGPTWRLHDTLNCDKSLDSILEEV